jgi:hypothetical protein
MEDVLVEDVLVNWGEFLPLFRWKDNLYLTLGKAYLAEVLS